MGPELLGHTAQWAPPFSSNFWEPPNSNLVKIPFFSPLLPTKPRLEPYLQAQEESQWTIPVTMTTLTECWVLLP